MTGGVDGGGVATYVNDAVGLGDGDGLLVACAFADADAAGIPVAVAGREADVAGDGVYIAGWVDPEVVHPAAAAATRSTKVTAPATGVGRTFMEPPAFGIEVNDGAENRWPMGNGALSIYY